MSWPGAIHHEIVWENFHGGFLFDPHLPYKNNDFYFLDKKTQTLILLAGVIYNRDELAIQLPVESRSFKDPELIFYALRAWGPEYVNHLNGDFAIFIYSKRFGQTFLFRDHIGIRPLAYGCSNKILWFSSDILSLSKALYSNKAINPQFILDQLISFSPASWPLLSNYKITPNKNISKVLPGHYIMFSPDGLSEKKYWCPESIKEDKAMSYETVMKELGEIVKDSAKMRSDTGYYASAHVSGGIDSGIVAALTRKEFAHQKDFWGFTWNSRGKVPENVEYDERAMAQKTCDFTGIELLFQGTDLAGYTNYVSNWRNSTDLIYEPNVREQARRKNVNLIFSGWGGDEFISISSLGIDSDLFFKFQWYSFLKKNPLYKPKQLLGKILVKVIYPAIGKVQFYNKKRDQNPFFKYINPNIFLNNRTIKEIYSWKSRREAHLRLLYNYHIPARIDDWAINGFRQGIEYRYPLLDKRIVEYMLKVPSRLLFKNGHLRIILREISKDVLPDEVRWRKSMHDPVRIAELEEVENNLCVNLMDELDEFKTNPDLGFINFALLEKDIQTIKGTPNKNNIRESLEILIGIKKVHKFIKGYYE